MMIFVKSFRFEKSFPCYNDIENNSLRLFFALFIRYDQNTNFKDCHRLSVFVKLEKRSFKQNWI